MRRLSILFLAFVLFLPIFGQNEEKYSYTTKMFLLEQAGKVNLNRRVPARDAQGQATSATKIQRDIAAAEMVDGVMCISAFIRLDDNTDVSDLESLGVVVRDKFINGLITAFIPVDKIEDVAAIARVKRINVASKMRPFTDKGRQYTNTDDVLTCSTDAVSSGLPKAYDGTGVLMGITDGGIDFQHKAFRDKNNGYRAVGAYQVKATYNQYTGYTSYTRDEFTQATMSGATTDDESDHGTHTCSTAGGSSVIISGSNVTVTDDHANATYGGMAPGSDLWLAGVADLNDTDLSASFSKIISYAESHDMPVVISNSWGSSWGPRDGTGEFADVVATYFGDSHPNRVCLFASSNDAGNTSTSAPGGAWFSGTASSSSPVGSIMNPCVSEGYDAYSSHLAAAWSRNNTSLKCNIYVIDSSGKIVASKTGLSGSTNGTDVSGLSSYISGTLALMSDSHNGKKGLHLCSNGYDYIAPLYYGYRLAVEFYPSSGSAKIDVWADGYNWFSADKTTSGHTWIQGSDDMSVSDEATIPNAISVGAYVTKTSVKNYQNQTQTYDSGSLGDIAYFSSYAVASASPTGEMYPWITAPGAQIISAVNHYSSEYISGDSRSERVNSNTTYPYGAMQGTSMATPTAAGIVALWLQVAKENDIELTLSDIKTIMKESAIKDSYTNTGSNHTHFGNGKIDALAGIKYILDNYASNDPVINVNPSEMSFNGTMVNQSATQTLTVTGRNLTAGVTATLGGADAAMFTLSPTSLASAGGDITVTYSPTAVGEHTATITLSSTGAEPIVVNVTGVSTFSKSLPVLADASNIGDTQFTATWTDATDAQYVSSYDLDVMIAGGAPVESNIYSLVTDASTLAAGDKIIVVSSSQGKAMNSTFTTSYTTSYFGEANVTVNNNQIDITDVEGINVFTLEGNSGAWLLKQADGGYLTSTAVKKLAASEEGTAATIAISDNNATITFGDYGRILHNVSSTRFTTYTSNTNNSMLLPQIYRMVSGGSNAPRRATEEGGLTHRSITGITAKTYTVTDLKQGETYNYKVRANYVDQSTGDWTANKQVTLTGEKILYPVIVADPESLDLGTVTQGLSATATFDILAEDLKGDVTVAVTGTGYSVDPTTIAKADAEEGATVTVTFAPTAAGTFEGLVTISSEDAEDVTVSLTGQGALLKEVPVLTEATNVGSTSFTANWETVANALSYTLYVCKQAAVTTVSDVLTLETTGVTGTNYSEWSDKTVTSDAVYAGQSAGGNESIQLRSKNSNSGIVTTTSGGVIRKVTVDWNENTSSRTLDVYGSNTAYSSPSDLYDESTQGTLLGSIDSDSQTELEISEDYAYVGVRSNSGALWMNSITFDWEAAPSVNGPQRATEEGDADDGGLTVEGIEDGTYTVKNLTAGVTYQYKVKVVYTDDTQSDWSDLLAVTLPQYKRGDVNGDGIIDVQDVTDLLDVVLGNISSSSLKGDCHVAGNETIDVTDVSELIDIVLGSPTAE